MANPNGLPQELSATTTTTATAQGFLQSYCFIPMLDQITNRDFSWAGDVAQGKLTYTRPWG